MPTILNSALALPPATRGLTLTLIGCSTVYFFLRLSSARKDPGGVLDHVGDAGTTVPWLTLVPSNVVYAPWTLLSSGFTETNLIEVRSSFTLILTLMIKLTNEEVCWRVVLGVFVDFTFVRKIPRTSMGCSRTSKIRGIHYRSIKHYRSSSISHRIYRVGKQAIIPVRFSSLSSSLNCITHPE